MDNNIVQPIETLKAMLAIILALAAFAVVGTMDHEQEVAHERWMAELEESGAWVIR